MTNEDYFSYSLHPPIMNSLNFSHYDSLKGDVILFYIPYRRKSPVYREIIGKILCKSELRSDSGTTEGTKESTSILLFSVPSSISNLEIERIFKSFGEIKEIFYNNVNSKHYSENYNNNDESAEPWIYITYNSSSPINKMKQDSEFDSNYLFRMLYLDESIVFDDTGIYESKKNCIKGVQEIIMDIAKKRADPGPLQREIDLYMAKYDIETEIRKENLKLESTIPDKDGFIKIVNKKQKTADGTVVYSFCPEVGDCIRGFRNVKNTKNKEKKKEYFDFYKFQIREKKMRDMQKLLH
ncbi:hypothetical protein FG386_003565 [Cryptosporidium ryanae]|uniref:uncharacterized protein n=1 Tax=Cryptosporidium ryanae TaxID=515981 RepID=UPI003519E379|nr:hypothetical protein FG386_003565 [Cryptosporidium ryanae]